MCSLLVALMDTLLNFQWVSPSFAPWCSCHAHTLRPEFVCTRVATCVHLVAWLLQTCWTWTGERGSQ